MNEEANIIVASHSNSSTMITVSISDLEEIRRLGHQYRALIEGEKVSLLRRAILVWKAKRQWNKIGRGSKFNGWLTDFCPDLTRRQADRLTAIVDHFLARKSDSLSDFPEETVADLQECLQQFSLVSLYALATPAVTDEVRRIALDEAKAGHTVSLARVQELIKDNSLPDIGDPVTPAKRPTTKTKTTVVVPTGKITIEIDDLDLAGALQAALGQLKTKKNPPSEK